jgi:hypothetical protein
MISLLCISMTCVIFSRLSRVNEESVAFEYRRCLQTHTHTHTRNRSTLKYIVRCKTCVDNFPRDIPRPSPFTDQQQYNLCVVGPKVSNPVSVNIYILVLLSSRLLSKSTKIRIYKTAILPVFLYGCETWSLTLREEHRLRVF